MEFRAHGTYEENRGHKCGPASTVQGIERIDAEDDVEKEVRRQSKRARELKQNTRRAGAPSPELRHAQRTKFFCSFF